MYISLSRIRTGRKLLRGDEMMMMTVGTGACRRVGLCDVRRSCKRRISWGICHSERERDPLKKEEKVKCKKMQGQDSRGHL